MSKVQRELLDAQLRGTGVGYEQSVGESRENFAKLMSALPVPEGIRVHETSLGGRPALRDAPNTAANAPASIGSPRLVPVPCASTTSIASASKPAADSAARITRCWLGPLGAVSPWLRPS